MEGLYRSLLTNSMVDQPGWCVQGLTECCIPLANLVTDRLYLINLSRETLAVYEFKDYRPHELAPFARLTVESLYSTYPKNSPGYYIRLKLSELRSMWRTEWITLHETRAKELDGDWRAKKGMWMRIPHVDNIPFAALYGGIFSSIENGNGNKQWRH